SLSNFLFVTHHLLIAKVTDRANLAIAPGTTDHWDLELGSPEGQAPDGQKGIKCQCDGKTRRPADQSQDERNITSWLSHRAKMIAEGTWAAQGAEQASAAPDSSSVVRSSEPQPEPE
ncbi:hypothetical protein KUCAC02_019747, partial [Chaenocephalus aceratus]